MKAIIEVRPWVRVKVVKITTMASFDCQPEEDESALVSLMNKASSKNKNIRGLDRGTA